MLRAHEPETDRPTTIYVRFSHDNLPIGQLELPTTISASRTAVATPRVAVSTSGLHLSFDAAPSPDIVIHVSDGGDGRFEIAVDRRSGAKRFDGALLGTFPVKGDAWDYARSILEQFRFARDLEPPERRQDRIDGLGIDLWWQLPEHFRDFYWEQMHGQALSIVIHSQEPYIPWELIKPQREKGGDETGEMLGLAFSIGRWKQARIFRDPLTVSGFAVVAPEYRDNPLEYTAQEAEALQQRFGATLVQGRYERVSDLLRGTGVQAIHFAGHGRFEPALPNESKIELADSPLVPSDVHAAGIGQSDRPLVFFNACEVGTQGWSLTQIGGWADAFCDIGCTAFVGPYWAVNDRVAKKAALLFYETLDQNQTVGEAMRTVRRRFWEDDEFQYHPTWLAYSLHCHPNVTVRFNKPG